MIDRDFLRGFVKLYALSLAADGEVYGLKIGRNEQARVFAEPRYVVSGAAFLAA